MKTITLIAAALLIGCDASTPAPAPPSPTPLEATTLTAHRLRIDALPQMRLLATPEGREVLSYAVSCALPAGTSITAIAGDGTPYSFAGSLGLAPRWQSRTPTADERRRLAACVHARGTVPAGEPAGRLVGALRTNVPAGIGS
jgi:hypothetical protein